MTTDREQRNVDIVVDADLSKHKDTHAVMRAVRKWVEGHEDIARDIWGGGD